VRLGLDLAVVVIGGSAVVVYVVLGPAAGANGASALRCSRDRAGRSRHFCL